MFIAAADYGSTRPSTAGSPEVLTRLVRWEPGLDTSLSGVIRHEWVEEVYLLEGDLHDLTLDQTFRAGDFAARPPAWNTARTGQPEAA
ncbi:hypothetical protein ACFVW1_40245 [Streptomyces olivochromogenes]|uniref:hypothetical protein n=1 Tax=Streptomyces olivochromogenes TaxID=1963 RepID=UPI0036DA42ED